MLLSSAALRFWALAFMIVMRRVRMLANSRSELRSCVDIRRTFRKRIPLFGPTVQRTRAAAAVAAAAAAAAEAQLQFSRV
eukprot:1117-Heterococcus_DN1.PRE.3